MNPLHNQLPQPLSGALGSPRTLSIARLIPFVLLAALCWTGCIDFHPTEIFARHSTPIPGWKICWDQDTKKLDKAIQNDYQDYVSKLSRKDDLGLGPIMLYEDGTGQHAIAIAVNRNTTDWIHVLIYDRSNRRIKVVKYISGHASC